MRVHPYVFISNSLLNLLYTLNGGLQTTGIEPVTKVDGALRLVKLALAINLFHLLNLLGTSGNQASKAVPGRKTDVADAQWLASLARAGLLRASFIAKADLRSLRAALPD